MKLKAYTKDHFISDLKSLEQCAKAFNPDYTVHHINKQVGLYICNRTSYGGPAWTAILGGHLNPQFEKKALKECAGVATRMFTSSGGPHTNNANDYDLSDFNGLCIDVPHLIASLLGYIYPSILGATLRKQWFGWALDLYSGVGYLQKKYPTITDYEILKFKATFIGAAGCSIADMDTDIDAELLSKRFTPQYPVLLSELIDSYYSMPNQRKEKYKTFISTYGSTRENLINQFMLICHPNCELLKIAIMSVTTASLSDMINWKLYLKAMCYRFATWLLINSDYEYSSQTFREKIEIARKYYY